MAEPGASPPWVVGDRLVLEWRRRNATWPDVRRAPVVGEVIAADAASVTVTLPTGDQVSLARANGHQLDVARDAPRWVAGW